MVFRQLAFLPLTLLFIYTSASPLPQTEEITSADEKSDTYDSYEDYGDYDADSATAAPENDGLEDLLKLGAGLAEGFLGLLREKVKFVNNLLRDEQLRDQLGATASAGLNFTGQVARAAAPVVQVAVSSVPVIIDSGRRALERINTKEHQERTRQVVAGVSQAASQVPDLIGQGGKLLGSVIKAANDTAPLILDGIEEFTDQLPLITGFASAYAEVNAEQAQKVVQTFYTSLQCDLQCRDLQDNELKAECVVQFCKKKEDEEEDDYEEEV